MDRKEEYHDPDYPETSRTVKQEAPCVPEDERIARIKNIIRREFSNELELRENEIMLIDQRMWSARRLLHRLRHALVSAYYGDRRLHAVPVQLAMDREVASGQRRLHPSVRKLLGRRTADLDEIFAASQRRSLPRKDYSAMVQKRSSPAAPPAEPKETKSEPKEAVPPAGGGVCGGGAGAVLTLGAATRNQSKHRYRIIVGNTSRYSPGASAADRATHWWLLYVRGPAGADGSRVLRAVTVRLHASYAPHHTVRLRPPGPYRLARRGWGEFEARLELAFELPERNPPASLTHTIRLDARRTGLQTLGAETVLDVWLHSSQDMLQHAYNDPPPAPALSPTATTAPTTAPSPDHWMNFFTQDTTELDVDEMIIKPIKKEIKEEPEQFPEEAAELAEPQPPDRDLDRDRDRDRDRDLPDEILTRAVSPKKRIMKYIDPTTGKIYYLEMDRGLDLSKVQQIVIDDTTASIAPIRSNGLKTYRRARGAALATLASRRHIDNDHCYCGAPSPSPSPSAEDGGADEGDGGAREGEALARLRSVRSAVDYLLRRLPLAADDRYWRLDVAKRRNIEWSRAKLINRLVTAHVPTAERAWTTKQILVYSRLHGHYPTRPSPSPAPASPCPAPDQWAGGGGGGGGEGVRRLYPSAAHVCTLSLFDNDVFAEHADHVRVTDDQRDDHVDVGDEPPAPAPASPSPAAAPARAASPSPAAADTLPPASEDERLRFLYIERKCADIGIELRNEHIGHGYQYSAVHCVLLSAVRSFAEELIRTALACRLAAERPGAWPGQPSARPLLCLEHVYGACGAPPPASPAASSAASPAASPAASSAASPAASPASRRLAALGARALASRRKNTTTI